MLRQFGNFQTCYNILSSGNQKWEFSQKYLRWSFTTYLQPLHTFTTIIYKPTGDQDQGGSKSQPTGETLNELKRLSFKIYWLFWICLV